MPTFSSSNCALNMPALWPEIDGTEVESLVRGQMDQPWPSLVSKSAFLSEVVQKGSLHPSPLPSFSKHTPFTLHSLSPQRNVFYVGPEQHWATAGVASPSVCCSLNEDHSSLLLVKQESPVACGGGSDGGDSSPPHPRSQCWHLAEVSSRAFHGGENSGEPCAPMFNTLSKYPFYRGPLLLAGEWHSCLCDVSHFGQANPLLGAPECTAWSKWWEEWVISPPTRGLQSSRAVTQSWSLSEACLGRLPMPQIVLLVGLERGNSWEDQLV